MDNAAKKITRDLAIRRPRNLIITEISEAYRLEWPDAENLVNKIEKEHGRAIESKQRPFYIVLTSLLAASGLLLSASMVLMTLNGLMITIFRLPIPYLENALIFSLGIPLFLVSLRGVIRMIGGRQSISENQE